MQRLEDTNAKPSMQNGNSLPHAKFTTQYLKHDTAQLMNTN
jgi:hypothetical protein